MGKKNPYLVLLGELSNFLGLVNFETPSLIVSFPFVVSASQMVQVLNMTTAKILRYAVADEETVAELQKRIEEDTSIPAAKQELLLEAGLALEPHGLATQCAIDYTVTRPFHKTACSHGTIVNDTV